MEQARHTVTLSGPISYPMANLTYNFQKLSVCPPLAEGFFTRTPRAWAFRNLHVK